MSRKQQMPLWERLVLGVVAGVAVVIVLSFILSHVYVY